MFKDGHLYYTGSPLTEILFSMNEHSYIHRTVIHAPAGSAYSMLRRAYPFRTDSFDFQNLRR